MLFRYWKAVPEWAEDIPGVWKNKRSAGYSVPLNADTLLGREFPFPENDIASRI